MKRKLLTLALAALTIGLLGSCSKMNERIDGLDQRVGNIENEKIASIENQIAAINSSIADLGAIRKDITDQKAASETLGKRIDTLKAYVGDLSRYAEKDWATALFATLDQLDATKADLLALQEKVNGPAISGAISNLETKISAFEDRVSALEKMIQSVSITPAYSDGTVEAVNGILTLKCIVSPAEALKGMQSLKDSLLIFADSVKVKTKAATSAYMEIKVSEASVLDAAQGAITLTADISECLPKGEGKALTVAVNIKNGISDFTTEFVPVTATKIPTFKAVYNTNGGANTLTFYYDDVDHSGEGITVYDNLPTAATKADDWGYNGKRGEIKSVVIDASVAGYKGLTSTAFMFQDMATATNISGAEYLDVSNVTDMNCMFQNFGGGASGNPTTLNSVPDVSGWNTGNVTNMAGVFAYYGNNSSMLDKVPDVSGWNTGKVTNMFSMFQKYGHESQNFNAVPDVSNWDTGNVTNMPYMFYEYGYKSTALNTVPDVSGWNTGKVENMQQMFYEYGNASTNISCVLDLSGWDLSKITEKNGDNVFNFNPSTFKVTIPAKTGEKSNEGGVWYYGDGTNSIAPPTGKTFTLPAAEPEYVEIGGLKWATKNLGAEKVTDYGDYFAWGETAPYYEGTGGRPATPTWKSGKESGYAWESYCGSSSFSEWSTPPYDATTKILKPEFDAAAQILGNGWRMPTSADFQALNDACGGKDLPITGGSTSTTEKGVYWCTDYDGVAGLLFCDGTNKLFFPAAGRGDGTDLKFAGTGGCYWSSSLNADFSITNAYYFDFNEFYKELDYMPSIPRYFGHSVRPVK